MQTKYRWKLVAELHSGHRIFLDEDTRKLAIADNSGLTPDARYNGVLWLSEDKEVTLALYDVGPRVSIPVSDGCVMSDLASVPQLADLGLKLGCSDRFGQHMDLWRQVIARFDAQAATARCQ